MRRASNPPGAASVLSVFSVASFLVSMLSARCSKATEGTEGTEDEETVFVAPPKATRWHRELPMEQIAAFCRRWRIARLEVFGSALREDFRPESDVDLLATYAPGAHWSLLDRVRMKLELETILGREVDLLNRRALEHAKRPARAASILAEAQPIYAEP